MLPDWSTIPQSYRVLLPPCKTLYVTLVGVGGTGSALALSLGRLAYHLQQKGHPLNLCLVDPDTVETKNVGRQHFSVQGCVGHNKAKVMALRLNAAWGLDVRASSQPFTPELYQALLPQEPRAGSHLLIGAVDNEAARQQLADTLAHYDKRLYVLDAGNEYQSGQVLMGNTTQEEAIVWHAWGLCDGLPSPYIQEPLLLQPVQMGQNVSCADLSQRVEQSLVVNQMVAAIASQYCYQFLLKRELTTMATTFSLRPPTMKSTLITKEEGLL